MIIQILIADDHTMFADGVESLLAPEKDMQVVGKVYSGREVIPFLKAHEVHVVLLDINLPDMSGIEVCKAIVKDYPATKVLALSMFNEESYVSEILNRGASGYILKNTGRVELLQAIRKVHSGESYFSKEVTETIMQGLMKKQQAPAAGAKKLIAKVSRREKEVLRLIVGEYTTQEIADQLFISLKTVESHRSALLAKMNARNTAGLVKAAIEFKLLDDEG